MLYLKSVEPLRILMVSTCWTRAVIMRIIHNKLVHFIPLNDSQKYTFWKYTFEELTLKISSLLPACARAL